jgi:hypothetical protein
MVENIQLTKASIAAIEKSVGMTYQEMISRPATDIDHRIEEKYAIKLDYNSKEEDPHIDRCSWICVRSFAAFFTAGR